jgi:hypothetical protein
MTNPLYLDPGSASLILQVIGGGVVAVGVALKLFWRRILVGLHLRHEDDDTAATVPKHDADTP